MGFINNMLVQLEQESINNQNVLILNEVWKHSVVKLDQLNTQFDQDVTNVLLTINTTADINQLTQDIAIIIRNPFTFKSDQIDVNNFKLYFNSILDKESWDVFYDKFIQIVPFTPTGRLVFSRMNEYIYKMCKTCDNENKIKEILIEYYTTEILLKTSQKDEQ